MAKRRRITQKQFHQIASAVHAQIFPEIADPVPATDCDAVRAFVAAGQAILDRDCAILSPPMSMRKAKKVAVKK